MAGRKALGTGAEQPEAGREALETRAVGNGKAEDENGLKNDNTETYIYVGPTVRKGMLRENQIFTGEREAVLKFIKPVIEKIPQVEKLVIPASRLAEVKGKISKKGTLHNKYYNDIRALDGR